MEGCSVRYGKRKTLTLASLGVYVVRGSSLRDSLFEECCEVAPFY